MPDMDEGSMEMDAPPPRRRRREGNNPMEQIMRMLQQQQEEDPEVGCLVTPTEQHDFRNMVLFDECKQSIMFHLKALANRQKMEVIWNISKIQPQAGRCILNFIGEPGVGKTMAALAVARHFGKRCYQVDYASIISCYHGMTLKNIKYAFARAKHHNAILFFDEADALLSRRLSMDRDSATSVNQNRDGLMQELDRFDGIVIMCSNLFENYDQALLRRIAAHIEFKLPDHKMRVALFKMHLPNSARVKADLDQMAKEAEGFSGGDILTVCLNAMYAASWDDNPDRWLVTTEVLETEIRKVQQTKANWSKGLQTNSKNKPPIVLN